MVAAAQTTIRAVRECAEPVIAAVEENLRGVKQAVADGREKVEDCAAEAKMEMRRHPFATLAIAVGVGSLLGCLVGFTLGHFRGRANG